VPMRIEYVVEKTRRRQGPLLAHPFILRSVEKTARGSQFHSDVGQHGLQEWPARGAADSVAIAERGGRPLPRFSRESRSSTVDFYLDEAGT